MLWSTWLPLPVQFLFWTLVGLVGREQQKVIDSSAPRTASCASSSARAR